MQLPTLAELDALTARSDWLRLGEAAMGMYYDMDGAILQVFRVTDETFSLRFAPDGGLLACIEPRSRLRSLREVDRLFYRFWARVSFPLSLIQRRVDGHEVSYSFITGDRSLGYRGHVILRGDCIRQAIDRAGRSAEPT